MEKRSLTAGLLGIYAYILMICILLYALVWSYKLDITLTTNLLIWSATLFAPVAVYYGFKSWKIQRFEEHKIKAITDIKENILKFNEHVLRYRLYGKNLHLMEHNYKELMENEHEFARESDALRLKIMFITQHNAVYFNKAPDEVGKIIELNNNLVDVVNIIRNATTDIAPKLFKNTPVGNHKDYEISLFQKIYLVDISNERVLFLQRSDQALMNECKAYEKKHINQPIDEFYNYLDQLLLESYNL